MANKYLREKHRLEKEAKELWSLIVMRNYGYRCFVDNKKADDPHHFVPRSQSANLKYDTKNGVALCRGCHNSVHNKSDPFIVLAIGLKKGKEWLDYLRAKKQEKIVITKPWLINKIEELKKEYEAN